MLVELFYLFLFSLQIASSSIHEISVDVSLASAFIKTAQIFLGFNLLVDFRNHEADLSYVTHISEPKPYSLAPYRTLKYAIYMRDSGTISRKFYLLGACSKSYLLAQLALIGLLNLGAIGITKWTSFRRNILWDTFMLIYNIFVSNGEVDSSSASISLRIELLVFSLSNMVIWTAVVSFLAAEQVTRLTKPPFTNLHELVQLGTIPICAQPESTIFQYILETVKHRNVESILNGDLCPKAFHEKQHFADTICHVRDRIAFVDENNFATEFNSWKRSHFPCKIVQVVANIYSFPVAFTHRPGFPFREDFNRM